MKKGQRRVTLTPLTRDCNRDLLCGMTRDERLVLLVKIVRRIRQRALLALELKQRRNS